MFKMIERLKRSLKQARVVAVDCSRLRHRMSNYIKRRSLETQLTGRSSRISGEKSCKKWLQAIRLASTVHYYDNVFFMYIDFHLSMFEPHFVDRRPWVPLLHQGADQSRAESPRNLNLEIQQGWKVARSSVSLDQASTTSSVFFLRLTSRDCTLREVVWAWSRPKGRNPYKVKSISSRNTHCWSG